MDESIPFRISDSTYTSLRLTYSPVLNVNRSSEIVCLNGSAKAGMVC